MCIFSVPAFVFRRRQLPTDRAGVLKGKVSHPLSINIEPAPFGKKIILPSAFMNKILCKNYNQPGKPI